MTVPSMGEKMSQYDRLTCAWFSDAPDCESEACAASVAARATTTLVSAVWRIRGRGERALEE